MILVRVYQKLLIGKRGGGFRLLSRLAPSLLEQDKYGNWVISKHYKPEMLAEAMCKHMGFTYAPSQNPDEYWNHGYLDRGGFYLCHDAEPHSSSTNQDF